jgi:hypothetical protein
MCPYGGVPGGQYGDYLAQARRPMAFIVALFLVTLSPFSVMFNVSASPSQWQVPNECLSFLFVILLPLILALFPSGHFVPRWMRWPVIAFLVVQAPFTFFLRALRIASYSRISPIKPVPLPMQCVSPLTWNVRASS